MCPFHIWAYVTLRWKTKSSVKTVPNWPDGALSQLQDCVARTNWDIFEHQDLSEYTETVLFYISCCTENVTVEKRIRTAASQEPTLRKVSKRSNKLIRGKLKVI